MTLTLNTINRKAGEKKEGFIPAVLYAKGFENKNVFVAANDFIKIFRKSGESAVINLTGDVNESVFVHELQRNSVTYEVNHLDFKVVIKGQKIHVNVPLNFIGDAPALKLGANLVKVMYEISLEADAIDIPREVNVDLGKLISLDSNITVADLVLPEGVSLYHVNPEDVIASVISQVEEDLSNPVTQIDMNSVAASVERGKKEVSEE